MHYLIRKPYWEWVKDEARFIGSDGCTGVKDWNKECCFEHDLACYYERNPRDAYLLYCENPEYFRTAIWGNANKMSRRGADYAFALCNLEWSPSRTGSARGLFRFIGVRIGALLGIGKRQPKDG